jgi:glycosyltransferase involved in cell wall biosynthesis
VRIAVYAEQKNPSSYYRAIEPMTALARKGHAVHVNVSNTEVIPAMLDSEVLLISRWVGAGTLRMAQTMRAAGMAVVWDLDDAVTLAPELNPTALDNQRRRRLVEAMARFADVVTTTTEPLAEQFRAIGVESFHVIDNYLGDHFADLQPEPHDGLVIGWAAWLDHQADWKQLELHATFERLLDAHPSLRVESVGLVSLNLPPDRYRQTHAVPLEQLGRQLTRFDMGIAPIADTPFNRARSSVKVKEYAAAGVPWLASPVGPYVGLGPKQGGRLVPDDQWYRAIDELLSKPRLLRRLARRARRWGAGQLVADNTGPWEDALADAVERSQLHRRKRA